MYVYEMVSMKGQHYVMVILILANSKQKSIVCLYYVLCRLMCWCLYSFVFEAHWAWRFSAI